MFNHPLQAVGDDGAWATESRIKYVDKIAERPKSVGGPIAGAASRPGKTFTQRKVDYPKRDPQWP